MKIDKELVKKVASNARIELTEEETEILEKDFHDVLEAFSKVQEVETEAEASIQPVAVQNVFREDELRNCLNQEEALALTEHKKDGYYKGPKVL